ncbi:unnamed protein product [Nezara viridula]|uniref:Uncharacterized protein n=1 Tax=Nezara viridula TaxID=85310 RepID=A0A9P0MNS1_NEZVI|nr:unnamed protein product [Nezara viridula]
MDKVFRDFVRFRETARGLLQILSCLKITGGDNLQKIHRRYQ